MPTTTDRVEIMRVYEVALTPCPIDGDPEDLGTEDLTFVVEVPLRYHPLEADRLSATSAQAAGEAIRRAIKLEQRANLTSADRLFIPGVVKLLRHKVVPARPGRGGRLPAAA